MISTPLQQFQYIDKYSRWDNKRQRRETWPETVTRSINHLRYLSNNKLSDETYAELWDGMYKMDVMPSMRLVAMAGDAAKAVPVSLYNCSFIGIDRLKAISEALYVSMAGCGVGYSVEKKYTSQLPVVQQRKNDIVDIVVPDSAVGWAMSLESILTALFGGFDVSVDYSLIRPAGSPLKTKGGRASGKEPLVRLVEKIKEIVNDARGRRLTPLEVHDIMTTLCGCVVSGGQRRSAMLSLFDIDDEEMLTSKSIENIVGNENRWYANNSVNIKESLTFDEIASIMNTMHNTRMGEPGIFSSYAAQFQSNRRNLDYDRIGVNPCGEIILRNRQFCNLSIAVGRFEDTIDTLKNKVRLATIIGTIQSMATDFNYLDDLWKFNCEDERLLGVDITGQYDCPLLWENSADVFTELREHTIDVNKKYAALLGIKQSTAITTNKPSGNSSILLNSASGIHPRHSPYYIRRVRLNSNSPVYRMMKDQGFAFSPENGQGINDSKNHWANCYREALENGHSIEYIDYLERNANRDVTTWVASFPVESPNKNVKFKTDVSAIEQLEWWKVNKVYWTEHNPSFTCSYYDDELDGIIEWLYDNQTIIGGLSFLPQSDFAYNQAPYEEISESEYRQMVFNTPELNWAKLQDYEKSDRTEVAQTLACVAGNCDV